MTDEQKQKIRDAAEWLRQHEETQHTSVRLIEDEDRITIEISSPYVSIGSASLQGLLERTANCGIYVLGASMDLSTRRAVLTFTWFFH